MCKRGLTLVLVLATSALLRCWAQQESASSQGVVDSGGSSTAQSNNSWAPSSAQPISLGLGGTQQVDISLAASQVLTSNPIGNVNSAQGWYPGYSFGGTLQLSLDGASSQTRLNYTGNGIGYPDRTPSLLMYQNVGFSHSFRVGRWSFTAVDSFNYSPNSPFGGYGYGLPTNIGNAGQPVLSPQNLPNQSILTPYVNSFYNTVMGQVQYGITPRSSWTASASYGLLRFPDSSFSNTNQVNVSAGYNYGLSANDSVAITDTFSHFQYTDFSSSFWSNTVQLGYSHKLNARLALQLAGGPEIRNTTNLGLAQQSIGFAGNGSLLYSKARTSLALTGFAGTTGGSGVLYGATTQSGQFSVSQRISEAWITGVTLGYAHNSGLVQNQQSYNSAFVSPNMRRAITRNLGVTFNYTYQRQLSSAGCVGPSCATFSGSTFSFGVDYKFRPIRLE